MTDLPCLTSAKLAARHGFFTRQGGVSHGAYASLNCGLSGEDAPDAVQQNRARVAASLGLAPGQLLGLAQVHGTRVVVVEQPWAAGALPRADALVTDRPGIGLGIITADCAPVLFAAACGVVGAAHAGWRGALDGVLEATIAAMQGLGATDIAACIGPCIGQDSYQVGDDLRDRVLARRAGDAKFFRADGPATGHWRFDLAGYCAARLAAAGLMQVDILGQDTCADAARFFSHRRRVQTGGGALGHQIAVIRL